MQQFRKAWGMLGYVLLLVGLGALIVGISALAGDNSWAWLVFIIGVAVSLAAAALIFLVPASRHRDEYRDRTQRDPLMEEVTEQERQRYFRRYRWPMSVSELRDRHARSRRV